MDGCPTSLSLAALTARSSTTTTTFFNQDISQKIDTWRIGLLGSSTDFWMGGGNTSYSVVATSGNAELNPATVADLEGTRGNFTKVNFDVQRVQYLSSELSAALSLSGQWASKNLRGAERVSYGGPLGVRGYGVPSGTGDEGLLASAELRYLLPVQFMGNPVSALVFYDIATIHARKNPSSTVGANSATFDSLGVGVKAGAEGDFIASLMVASRLGGPYPIPTDGSQRESERQPQVWFSVQKWF